MKGLAGHDVESWRSFICCYNKDYSLIFFFFLIFHNFSLYDQSRFMHVLCIFWLVLEATGHMTSLKQRAATFRFRHDYRAQNSANGFVEHRLEAFLRQSGTL